MSCVLVLQKRHDYQSLPVDLFPSEMQKTIGRYMIDTFYNAKPFNSQQASQAKDILMKYVNDDIDEENVQIELLKLCKN